MTCRRKAGTTEHLLHGIIGQLSPLDIQDATGKSADNFYRCSNPNIDQKLHFDDAISLDEKLLKIGKGAVFLPHFKTSLSGMGKSLCPKDRFMNLSVEFGELANALRNDADPEELRKEAEDIVRVATQFIRDIDNDDYKIGGSA